MEGSSNFFTYLELQLIVSGLAIFLALILIFWDQLFKSRLEKRVNDLYREREKFRRIETQRTKKQVGSLAESMKAKPLFERLVSFFRLVKRAEDENVARPLRRAGYRGRAPVIAYLASKFLIPPIFFIVSVVYLDIVIGSDTSFLFVVIGSIFLAYFSTKIPDVFLKNRAIKRQAEVFKFWPDMLDILLLSVESGMSIEAAFRTVSQEIGIESPVISEEIMLTLAELSYLQNRVQAYKNLESRIDLELVRSVVTVLVQSERYGTSLAQGLRSLAQDGRNARMAAAEKKAAALPPRLTVPMIIFFLPVLFVIMMTPAVLQILPMMR